MNKILLLLLLAGCAGGTSTGNPDSEDVSMTGSAVSAVGGAMSSSGSGGSLSLRMQRPKNIFLEALGGIPEAIASAVCPSYKTAQSAGCDASGSDLWFIYNNCNFLGTYASWQGVQNIELSSGAASCGTFPSVPNGYLYRQFVTADSVTTPSSLTVKSALGVTLTVDDATAKLGNFDDDAIATIIHGGYGSKVGFGPGGARNSLLFGFHESIPNVFDHSLYTSMTVTPTSLTGRSLEGDVTIYHNILKVIGTAHFHAITHNDSCCWPSSGTITTDFTAGTNVAPTDAGAPLVGKHETMTLTGCGTASIVLYDGTTKNVTLSRCY